MHSQGYTPHACHQWGVSSPGSKDRQHSKPQSNVWPPNSTDKKRSSAHSQTGVGKTQCSYHVEVQAVNTNARVILDPQVDVFLDPKAKVSSIWEVIFSQLILSHLRRKMQKSLPVNSTPQYLAQPATLGTPKQCNTTWPGTTSDFPNTGKNPLEVPPTSEDWLCARLVLSTITPRRDKASPLDLSPGFLLPWPHGQCSGRQSFHFS